MECKYSYRFTEKAEQDFDEILRYISVDNYVIYYKAHYDEKVISIIRIVYGKRNLDEMLKTM